MPTPSAEEIRRFYERYYETWNAHDREGFIRNWTDFVTDISTEEPVGSPAKRGFKEVVLDSWDASNSVATMKLEHLIICGSEAAMVMTNEVTVGDEKVVVPLIQTIHYADDGSVHLRNWF
jgi:hypothetical protein